MAPNQTGTPSSRARSAATVRPLEAGDLDAVVAIDAALTGRSRHNFFERRLKAALQQPKDFVYVGACLNGELKGFVLVRLLGGEFGHDASAMLDAIGVDPGATGTGLGHALLSGVDDVLRHKGVTELQTETEWTNSNLLGFFAHAGFERAPRLVLKRGVGQRSRLVMQRGTSIMTMTTSPQIPQRADDRVEIDYSDERSDDFEALARDSIPVRSMTAGDLKALISIDRRITGHDRTGYYERKLAESMDESAVRVSLVAELDGRPAGFIMARVDFGEFGRAEPEAVIDTIGVDPDLHTPRHRHSNVVATAHESALPPGRRGAHRSSLE